jgi:membrane protein
MERITKFLQLQFCMLLLLLTVLPEFNLLSSLLGFNFDIPKFACKVLGLIGGGMAFYYFYKDAQSKSQQLPTPFLVTAIGGMALILLSMIPGIPSWLEYIAIILLLAALYLCKESLGIEWSNRGSQGAYFILLAVLLHVYNSIGDTMMTGIAALVGLIMYWIGLGKIRTSLDSVGEQGVSKLKIAVILGLVGVIIGWIPLIGGIIGGILAILAFVFEFMGYGLLKGSNAIGNEGQIGAGKLRTSMIILLAATVIGFIPGLGIVEKILSIIAVWFVFQGWSLILSGMETRAERV